jgi:hypothetical protein
LPNTKIATLLLFLITFCFDKLEKLKAEVFRRVFRHPVESKVDLTTRPERCIDQSGPGMTPVLHDTESTASEERPAALWGLAVSASAAAGGIQRK